MAHPHKSYDPNGPIKRLREICLALDETIEKEAWGECTFRVDGKMFAMTDNNHHGDGRVAVWCRAPLGFQSMMVGMAPERFFVPPYVGHNGWVGVRLDVEVDWDELATILEQGYRMTARRYLTKATARGIPAAPPPRSGRKGGTRPRLPLGRPSTTKVPRRRKPR